MITGIFCALACIIYNNQMNFIGLQKNMIYFKCSYDNEVLQASL